MLSEKITELARREGGERRLAEVIIGLGFALVCLDDDSCGLAYTLRERLEHGCDAFDKAGELNGMALDEVLPWIGGSSVIASSIGLAAANALLQPPEEACAAELFDALDLHAGERVVTVGRFGPMENRLKGAGVELEVIEAGGSPRPLDGCDVALITATSIINNTLHGLLERSGGAREVVILGPSTPYAPAAFADTPVTLLAGSVISDLAKVRTVVSQGGGTRTMGRALAKWVARIA